MQITTTRSLFAHIRWGSLTGPGVGGRAQEPVLLGTEPSEVSLLLHGARHHLCHCSVSAAAHACARYGYLLYTRHGMLGGWGYGR